MADSPIELSMVDIATWPAFTASLSTPAEQEDSELIVKPRGWKSGLRSVRLVVRASCRSCRDLPPSEHQKFHLIFFFFKLRQNLKYFFLLSVMLSQALENFSPQLSLGAFVAKVGLVGLAPTFLEE